MINWMDEYFKTLNMKTTFRNLLLDTIEPYCGGAVTYGFGRTENSYSGKVLTNFCAIQVIFMPRAGTADDYVYISSIEIHIKSFALSKSYKRLASVSKYDVRDTNEWCDYIVYVLKESIIESMLDFTGELDGYDNIRDSFFDKGEDISLYRKSPEANPYIEHKDYGNFKWIA